MEYNGTDNTLGGELDGGPLPRRIRHITCLRVCNLTSFPVRDAVTSALSQPVEPSQLNTLSHLSDDLDLSSIRRARKLSTTSTNTKSSSRRDDDDNISLSLEARGRRNSHTRGTLASRNSEPNGSPPGMPRIPYGSPRTIRRHGRANSVASSMSEQTKSSVFGQGISFPMTGSSFSMVLPDISQEGLEGVIDSRLVETFLAITILSTNSAVDSSRLSSKKMTTSSHGSSSKKTSMRRTQASSVSSLSPSTPSKGRPTSGTPKAIPLRLKLSHSRTSSAPTYQPDEEAQIPSRQIPLLPDYLSSIHRPSVNPTFFVDARPGQDFLAGSNTNTSRLRVELWGRTRGVSAKVAGKQKQKTIQELAAAANPSWNVMQDWELSLDDLLPLSQQNSPHTLDLPSNTLLVTLDPPGETYYLPSTHVPSPHLPFSSVGYSSDPETTIKKGKRNDIASGSTVDPTSTSVSFVGSQQEKIAGSHMRHHTSVETSTPVGVFTHSYPQLFELVNLQSLIRDHEHSFMDLIQKIDKHLEEDPIFPLRREISERQHRLGRLHAETKAVIEETAARKKELEHQRKRLGDRRRSLVSARILEEANILDTADLVQEVEEERERLKELRAKFTRVRVGLLSTLASIFPIELYSPPDLLFTILDVPLPIPSTATDPAPPLSLPDHPNVNEDSIGTSLGYVAQLLQLLAAYLGRPLIYPATCVGSRSFIKDGISAMVGPRMFPLFPKGVDTYRFEYGVFLLNKNIEMLMVDRDLRALDIRHTLPNLKNLALTVTHGEVVSTTHKSLQNSPVLSMLGLDSSTLGESSDDISLGTPKAKKLDLEPLEDPSTPSASGSTTPTVTMIDEKKPRPFLGLSFSDFLRGRYPSTSRASIKSVPGGSDGGQPQVNVSGSSESFGGGTPEAHSDLVQDDTKPPTPGGTEQAPNTSQHEGKSSGHNHSFSKDKHDELTVETETVSVHVH